MARQTAAQKPKAVMRHQCGSCDEMFTGKICPGCGEENDIFRINAEGIRLDEVANAVGATHSLPIHLASSPEFDADLELEAATRREMKDVMQEAQLDKVRASAAVQATKRLRAVKELEDTEKGFAPPRQGEPTGEDQSGFASMSPGIFLQALGGWDPEQREQFLNQLASNPMLALNLSMMMNPGKSGGMNQMGMMNPMAMMGQMMQQPTEPVPQASATDMVTAMIAGMASLKELSGGDNGSGAQMDRLLDKMDDMRKETEDLKLKLVEAQNKNTGIGAEEVQRIINDALSRNSANHANIQEGVKVLDDLTSFKDSMVNLGWVQETSKGIDPAQTLEEKKFEHQVKMDDRKDKQAHELRLKEEEAAVAKANIQSEFVTGLFAATPDPHDNATEENVNENKPIDVVKVDTERSSTVIS